MGIIYTPYQAIYICLLTCVFTIWLIDKMIDDYWEFQRANQPPFTPSFEFYYDSHLEHTFIKIGYKWLRWYA